MASYVYVYLHFEAFSGGACQFHNDNLGSLFSAMDKYPTAYSLVKRRGFVTRRLCMDSKIKVLTWAISARLNAGPQCRNRKPQSHAGASHNVHLASLTWYQIWVSDRETQDRPRSSKSLLGAALLLEHSNR
jgi:hypothetical protein